MGVGHLYRRSSGIYVVRIVVPVRHRGAVGRTEIHASTGHRTIQAATLAALDVLLIWKRRFAEFDQMDPIRVRNSVGLFEGNGRLSLTDAAEAMGFERPTALLREILNEHGSVFVDVSGRTGYFVAPPFEVEVEIGEDGPLIGHFIVNDGIGKGIERPVEGPLEIRNPDAYFAEWERGIAAKVAIARDVKQNRLVFFDEPCPEVMLTDVLVTKGRLRKIRDRILAATPVAAFTEPAMSRPVSQRTGPAKHERMKVSALIDLYVRVKSPKWGADQKQRVPTTLGYFTELVGDVELASVEVSTVVEYREMLMSLPANLATARRAMPDASLKQLIDWARDSRAKKKTAQAAGRYVAVLSELFTWAVNSDYMGRNPARGLGTTGRPEHRRSQDARAIFSTDELRQIFGVEWYRTGRVAANAKGRIHQFRPHHYWLPLLALFSGGRLNELAQLFVTDVRRTASGTDYISFALDHPEKRDTDAHDEDRSHDGAKRLKTVNATRQIPLHPYLVDRGFVNYVAALRAAGHERVFPELLFDPVKGYGKAAGSWFNERFLGQRLKIPRDGTKTFHSFRHQFISAAFKHLNEATVAQLAGHQRGSTQSGERYRKDQVVDQLKNDVARIEYPDLPSIARFDIETGIKAIVDAQFVKSKHAMKSKPGK
jgi:integrase